MGCNFHKNALFDDAKINGFFVASKSVFHKQASFWNVDFKEIPNFSGVGFTESNLVNFVNAKVDNSFEKLSQLAKNETKCFYSFSPCKKPRVRTLSCHIK